MSVSVISEDKDDFDWKESMFEMSVQMLFNLVCKQEKYHLEKTSLLAGEDHIAHSFHVQEISIALALANYTSTRSINLLLSHGSADKYREKIAPPWSKFPSLGKKQPQPAPTTLFLAGSCFSSSKLRCRLCCFTISQCATGLCKAL